MNPLARTARRLGVAWALSLLLLVSGFLLVGLTRAPAAHATDQNYCQGEWDTWQDCFAPYAYFGYRQANYVSYNQSITYNRINASCSDLFWDASGYPYGSFSFRGRACSYGTYTAWLCYSHDYYSQAAINQWDDAYNVIAGHEDNYYRANCAAG